MRTTILILLLAGGLPLLGVAGEEDVLYRNFDVSAITAPHPARFGPWLGAPLPEAGIEEEREAPEPLPFVDGDQLVEMIRESVASPSWEGDGALLAFGNGTLFARNRPAVLQELAAFLSSLEQAAERRILFQVRVFEGKGGKPVASGSVEARPGVPTTVKVTNRVRLLTGYEAEVAQRARIAKPFVLPAEEGLVVDLVGQPALDGRRVVVEALVQRGTFDRPIGRLRLMEGDEGGEPPLGEIDIPVFRRFLAFTTSVLESGGATTIPLRIGDRAARIEIRAALLGRLPDGPVVDAGSLTRIPTGWSIGYPEMSADERARSAPRPLPEEDSRPLLGDPEEVVDLVTTLTDPWYWEEEGTLEITGEGLLFLKAKEDVRKHVLSFLTARESERLHPVRLELRFYSRAGEVKPGAVPAFEPGSATLVGSGLAVTLPGRNAFLSAGDVRNYVADYKVEVAEGSQLANPVIGQSFAGFAANLRPRLSIDRSRIRLDVGLLFAHRPPRISPRSTGARHLGVLSGIEEHRAAVHTSVVMPAAGTYVLDLGPSPVKAGERLVAVITSRVE